MARRGLIFSRIVNTTYHPHNFGFKKQKPTTKAVMKIEQTVFVFFKLLLGVFMITINGGDKYRWSGHALNRWTERFPNVDKSCDFATAKLASKKQKSTLRKLTPINAKIYMKGFEGRYFLVSKAGVVYVVASKGANVTHDIVTVFSMTN